MSGLLRAVEIAGRLPAELQAAQRRGVQKVALTVTRGIRAQVRTASGGDNRLSGVGRRGARVGVRYDIRGSTNPTALIRATGPMHFLEHDMPGHTITPRGLTGRGSRKRATGRRALKFGDTYAASAQHPGSRGKRPFERGYIATRDEAGRMYDLEVQRAIRRVL